MARTSRTTLLTRATIGVLVAAGALAGCGGGDEAEPADTGAASAEATTAPEPTAEETMADETSEQGAALDKIVAEAQSQMVDVLEASGGVYSDIKLAAVQPDTLEYQYVYAEPVDVAAATAALEAELQTLQDAVDSTVIPEMIRAGVTVEPKVRYTYFNPDSSLVWTHTFSSTS